MKRLFVALLALAATAPAYYHFLHYTSRGPIPEKFDVAALPGKTLLYYVSDRGPENLAGGDSFTAMVSQFRRAGQVWNSVTTSDLRVAFGGLVAPDAARTSTPRIDISFDLDVPGIAAVGGVESSEAAIEGAGGRFVPIVRSVVRVSKDVSSNPSWEPRFFMTATHELGHALGLQHSFTGGVMSVNEDRAVTPASPLTADDIAAISLLYPAADFRNKLGSISGRVTASGAGVHMASVVALTPNGHAVNALTLPDGTYRIDGLPAADYHVYAQALPPAWQSDLGPGDVVLPLGPEGEPVPAGPAFRTEFYPGTRDPLQAGSVRIRAGGTAENIDFSVEEAPLKLYGVWRYSFPGWVRVSSGHVNVGSALHPYLVVWGNGMVSNDAPAPGLKVSVLGGAAAVPSWGLHSYIDPQWLQIDFIFNPAAPEGPCHLVFSLGDDLHVVPAGLNLVKSEPPAIASMEAGTEDGVPVVTLSGHSLGPSTRVVFDGMPARVLRYEADGMRLTVIPPPAPAGHKARVEALNPDGQITSFLHELPIYSYDETERETGVLSRPAVAAGTEAMIEVSAPDGRFTDSAVDVGFGGRSVRVKGKWVVSPTELRVNVAVPAAATPGSAAMTVFSGLRTLTAPLEIEPASERATLTSELTDAQTGGRYVYPGSIAALAASNLGSAEDLKLMLNGAEAKVVSVSPTVITFEVPDLPAGPAVVTISRGGGQIAPPVFVTIGPRPPEIKSVMETTARLGNALTLYVAGLGDAAGHIEVTIGGVVHSPAAHGTPEPGREGEHRVLVFVSHSVELGQLVPVTVSIDGRTSAPYTIAVTP